MTIDGRSPCIIGVARRTWHPADGPAPEPLAMWEQVVRESVADTGVPGGLADVDSLFVVHCMSWDYDDPTGRLAARLGIEPAHRQPSVLAGTAGQRMVNAAAERMLAGGSELAVVVGGEALATRRAARASGDGPGWSHPAADQDRPPIDLDEWIWPTEWAHDVLRPTLTFAALDTARRAALGVDPDDYHRSESEVLAHLCDVAAADPGAWFPQRRTAAEIGTVTPQNRLISSPYTKYMVAVMDVDMAAAVIVATHDKADALGVPRDQRVYLRGWSFGRDATHVAERPRLDASPAMAAAASDALGRAGIGVDELTRMDLYSCFASSVLFATDALGIATDDPRGLTVVGGLPYHGGPASNYTTHAVAGTVERLRSAGSGYGLVTGVGMHMTKHVWAVYGTEPGPVTPPDYGAVQARIDREPPRAVVARVDRPVGATIGCWSVTHGRTGSPASALVVADLDDGARAYGRTTDPDALAGLSVGEWVGRRIRLRPGSAGVNEVVLD